LEGAELFHGFESPIGTVALYALPYLLSEVSEMSLFSKQRHVQTCGDWLCLSLLRRPDEERVLIFFARPSKWRAPRVGDFEDDGTAVVRAEIDRALRSLFLAVTTTRTVSPASALRTR
jgi:hypothetical protein